MQRFEDVLAWRKARESNRMVYAITREPAFARDFGMTGQIQRASVSVMANIAEGFERGSLPEFVQFLSIAKGSCAEVRSHLYAALDVGYLDEARFQMLSNLTVEVTSLIASLKRSVRKRIDELK